MGDAKKILPLAEPPITTFPSYAATLGILSNYEETYDWFYSHYIQLCTVDIVNRYDGKGLQTPYMICFFADTDPRRFMSPVCDNYFLRRDICPYLDIFEIPHELITSMGKSFVSIIKHCIDLNMYLFGLLNVSHIKQYGRRGGICHEVFIYGYDDDEEVVYFADFPISDTYKYTYSKCSYQEIENAFAHMFFMYSPVRSIAAIRYTNALPYAFDFSYVQNSIRDYIEPDNSKAKAFNDYVMSYFSTFNFVTETYLGVNVYDYFSNYIDFELANGKDFLFATELFHGLYDHKEMMLKRIEHFMSKGYLASEKALLLDEYTKVRDNALIIRNTVLKFNASKKADVLRKADLVLKATKNLEIRLLKEIFDLD